MSKGIDTSDKKALKAAAQADLVAAQSALANAAHVSDRAKALRDIARATERIRQAIAAGG